MWTNAPTRWTPEKLETYLREQCEIDDATGRAIHRKLKKPVTAVVPVHLYGQIADMDPILEIAAAHRMAVIEDACQAHGAEYFSKKENRWRKAGSMGDAAGFSFYPGKNLGACGEGGAVTTNNEGIARTVRMIRDHGQSKKYYHDMEGYNGRLDSIQAGFLRVKLKHLPRWNQQRVECAQRYNELLAAMSGSITLPFQPKWSKHVYHLYVVRTSRRDELQTHLNEAGIRHRNSLSDPGFTLQRAYESMGWKRGTFRSLRNRRNRFCPCPCSVASVPISSSALRNWSPSLLRLVHLFNRSIFS